jgi:heme/copper-type cytochrome/quinol oxidase subunit 1
MLAGIFGMVLATLIRLEFSYPGVGIFAGDSLQYLTIASAHAVIMVFLMILPLLFGAFGNYLLPTQLGVHDVAFPRLNSAAFWFFPSSLIMLCQLVCTDRRYQRMNCFNIREVQALLKRKFFNDLINTHDYHFLLDNTIMGLRYKTNELLNSNHSNFIFYNYGISLNHKTRSTSYGFSNESALYQSPVSLQTFLLVYNSLSLSFFNAFESSTQLLNFNSTQKFNIFTAFSFKKPLLDLFTFSNQLFQTFTLFITYYFIDIKGLFTLYINFFLLQPTFSFLNFSRYNLIEFKNVVSSLIPNTKSNYALNYLNYAASDYSYLLNSKESLLTSVNIVFKSAINSAFWYIVNFSVMDFNVMYYFTVNKFNFFVIHPDSVFMNSKNVVFPVDLKEFAPLSTVDFGPKSVFRTSSYDFLVFLNINYLFTPFSTINTFLFSFLNINMFEYLYNFVTSTFLNSKKENSLNFKSEYFNNVSVATNTRLSGEESSNYSRFMRFENPVFKYDYKSGNYFPPLYTEIFPQLMTTMADTTSGLLKPIWFFSSKYEELFLSYIKPYTNLVTNSISTNSSLTQINGLKQFTGVDGIFGFFIFLNNDSLFTNTRWVSINTLNQKFYKMFSSSSMQQRIYSNWRQLKFTREAWRCKLLSARHQKTLYKRYVNEDGVFWSIERNAKDLLPGWAMITPFSSRTRFTAIGRIDIGLMGVLLAITASIISGANFLVTCRYLATLNNRKMRDARTFFSECIMVASWMMISANPMLIIAIIMLLSDRHWQTSFFDYSGGGDSVLFQHMFWFFGHPEVYIIMIPSFGFINMSFSYYLRKRISARASLIYSLYTIAFLGFFVWGHHMYMVGLSHTTRMLFSTLTVMISVPAATKLMHWSVTISNSVITIELPFICSLIFTFLFVSGGISGMAVAHTGMDILFHDTFYVVGHFHILLAGAAMFSSFGTIYFYFPSLFGVKYSRLFAYIHFTFYLIGHFLTFIPMFWLGYAGMPRRVLDYPAALGGWHSLATGGHILAVGGMIAFFIMVFDSLRQARAATRNTFGISRFNTRLNFYLYEISRLTYVQRKGLFLYRYSKNNTVKLNNLNFVNFEYLETTVYSYTFSKLNSK